MTRYRVLVTSDCTQSVFIEVEAADAEDAADMALTKARSEAVDWELDDGNSVNPYLCDSVENNVEEIYDDGTTIADAIIW